MLLIFGSAFFVTFNLNAKCSTYPKMVTMAGIILSAVCLGRALHRCKKGIPIDAPGEMSWGQIFSAALTLTAAFAYIVCVRIIGYATTTFLFTTLFSYYLSTQTKVYSKRWVYPAVGFGTTLLLYAAFGTFLNVPLPKGILI